MLLKGQLAATTDPNMVQFISKEPNAKVIYIGDPIGYEDYIRANGIIVATALVPDYKALDADINGDMNQFMQLYYTQLSEKYSMMYFATILAALVVGKNILLFFPPDSTGLHYQEVLLGFIFNKLGIQTRTDNVKFGYNDAFTPTNAALMYDFNVVDPPTYLRLAGESFVNMIPKLVYDMHIPVADPSVFRSKEMYDYLNSYRINLLKTDKPLIKPFVREIVVNAGSNRT